MRSNRILAASLLILPALPALAAPSAKAPAAKAPLPQAPAAGAPAAGAPTKRAVVSVVIDPKPSSVRDVGGGRIASWGAMLTVNRGSHLVTVVQTNAADPAVRPGLTHVETSQTSVSAGNPTHFQLETWGPRPVVRAKIVQTTDNGASDPAQQPQQPQQPQPPNATAQPDGGGPDAATPPATKPPAPPAQKAPAKKAPAQKPTAGQKPSRP